MIDDQGGLCAYCEIDLAPAINGSEADLRVEHFHPKSDTSGSVNWALRWSNLLACCHGGSRPDVVDAASRYGRTKSDHSCDVPKAVKDLDGVILNPLTDIPASPALFAFQRAGGAISVDTSRCSAAGVPHIKAQATIDELGLNVPRLQRLREATLVQINQHLQTLITGGLPMDQARSEVAAALLRKNSNGHWPRFFSAIRSYLGRAAENQLTSIGYDG